MALQSNNNATAGDPASTRPAALLGIFDFSYQHYALGDLMTSQVNLAVMAIEQGLRQVDVMVMANPDRPSAPLQPFVTPANYITHLDNILPAFACNPLLRSLQVIRDVQTFNFIIEQHRRNNRPMWPDLKTHLKMQQDYPIGYRRVNAFHARHGHIPQLSAPRGYESWARHFHRAELNGRPLVIINPRQSALSEYPVVTARDAPLPIWYAFINAVAEKWPEALFVMVGQEWEHRLLHCRNVFIPRACGLRLAHELALMKFANLFMGTSSGFAIFATFSDVAYVIVNVEHRFAPHAEVRPNDRHYPFAKANQILTWRQETTEELLSLFDEVYSGVQTDRATSSRMAAISSQHAAASSSREIGCA